MQAAGTRRAPAPGHTQLGQVVEHGDPLGLGGCPGDKVPTRMLGEAPAGSRSPLPHSGQGWQGGRMGQGHEWTLGGHGALLP